MKSVFSYTTMFLVIGVLLVQPAFSQVEEEREGKANPMIVMAQATLYGAATGMILGLAYSLAADEDLEDGVKWGFVAGAGGGFLIGAVYSLARSEPEEDALLEFKNNQLAKLNVPDFKFRLHKNEGMEFTVNIFQVKM